MHILTEFIVSTILETETVVVTTTTFTTVYVPGEGGAAPARRDVKPWDHKLTNSIVARQVTVAPSKVPTYASACSGTVRYSSACSCIGISQKTTTVAVCIFLRLRPPLQLPLEQPLTENRLQLLLQPKLLQPL
jgi:hypothetical protein